jgi:cell division protein FtsB
MFDFDEIFKEKVTKKRILILFLLIFIGFYIYDLVFGKRSVTQLMELQNTLESMQKKVDNLRKENEKLQKEYFELKELEN